MDVRVGLWRRLSAEELMLLNCGVGEDSWESLELQGDQSWVFIGKTEAKAETPILWPPHAKSWLIGRLWCWEGLGARGEGDDRGWDGRMALPTRWTWVWVNSGSWWWTGRPSMLWFMGLQIVRHDWATELNWTEKRRTEGGCVWRKDERSYFRSVDLKYLRNITAQTLRYLRYTDQDCCASSENLLKCFLWLPSFPYWFFYLKKKPFSAFIFSRSLLLTWYFPFPVWYFTFHRVFFTVKLFFTSISLRVQTMSLV